MNPRVKAKWLEALRSGRFTQRKGRLAKAPRYGGEATYCCLGVLCEIAAEEGVVDWEWKGTDLIFGGAGTVLPHEVRVWAGLSDSQGRIDGHPYSLIYLNDVKNLSFEQIADVIEEHL